MGENLIRNRVLRGGTGLRGAPRDRDGIRKFSHHARQGKNGAK